MSDRIIQKFKHICNLFIITSVLAIGKPASIRAADIKVNSAMFFNFQECVQTANDVICNGYFSSKDGEERLTLYPGENTTITGVNGRSYPVDSILINDNWKCTEANCASKDITIAQGARYNTRFIFKNVSLPESKIALINIDIYSSASGRDTVKVRDIFIKKSGVIPPLKREATKIPPVSTTPTSNKSKPSPTTPPAPTTSKPTIPSNRNTVATTSTTSEPRPKVKRRVNSTLISKNLPQVKAGSFAQLCEQKQSLSVETRHTIDVLLRRFRTDDCTVADRILTPLTKLSLSRKQIIDLTPLTSLTNLRYLILDGNQIVDVTPLSNLSNLQIIYLRNNQIGSIESLAGLNKLRMLEVSNNQFKLKNCPVKPASICRF